jgi:hypothetical protein
MGFSAVGLKVVSHRCDLPPPGGDRLSFVRNSNLAVMAGAASEGRPAPGQLFARNLRLIWVLFL